MMNVYKNYNFKFLCCPLNLKKKRQIYNFGKNIFLNYQPVYNQVLQTIKKSKLIWHQNKQSFGKINANKNDICIFKFKFHLYVFGINRTKKFDCFYNLFKLILHSNLNTLIILFYFLF